MYFSIDINPKLGYDIQDTVCRKFMIMIYIGSGKTSVEDQAIIINQDQDGVLRGAKILLNIVSTWAFIDRFVCDDLYFASITSSEALKDIGISLILVFNTDKKL